MYTPLLLAFLASGFICQTFAHTLALYPVPLPHSLDCQAGAVSGRGRGDSECPPQDGRIAGFSEKNNGCITFNVAAGTGCAWMCEYCANQLGTTSYYFTDGVCTYQYGGCVGNPIASKEYTCCAA